MIEEYQCACGRIFPHHVPRTAHMGTCAIVAAIRERDRYRDALEKIRDMDGKHPDMVICLSLKIAKEALKQI